MNFESWNRHQVNTTPNLKPFWRGLLSRRLQQGQLNSSDDDGMNKSFKRNFWLPMCLRLHGVYKDKESLPGGSWKYLNCVFKCLCCWVGLVVFSNCLLQVIQWYEYPSPVSISCSFPSSAAIVSLHYCTLPYPLGRSPSLGNTKRKKSWLQIYGSSGIACSKKKQQIEDGW